MLLGSSVGELSHKLAQHHRFNSSIRWVALEQENHMVQKAKADFGKLPNLDFIQANILDYPYKQSPLLFVIMSCSFYLLKKESECLKLFGKSSKWWCQRFYLKKH